MIASSLRPPRRSGRLNTQSLTAPALPSRSAAYRSGGQTSGPSGTRPLFPGSRNASHHLAGILFLMFF